MTGAGRVASIFAILVIAPAPGEATEREDPVEELREIHREALEDPFRYFHMNAARADALAVQLQEATGEERRLELTFLLAHELLLAGRTKAALGGLHMLLEQIGRDPAEYDPRGRRVYDLLATAWLRLGEQVNCLEHPTADACILPLTDRAVHRDQEGSRRARDLYLQMLAADPGDDGARWLLDVATRTLGRFPEGVPERFRLPGGELEDPSWPRFPNRADDLGVAVDALSGGVAVADFDGDDLLDLVVSSYGLADPMRLFVQDGRGGFVERTSEAGLDGQVSGLNLVHADVDNDGDPDLLVLRGAWLGDAGRHPNSLLRNDEGRFVDVTVAAGLEARHPTQVAAFADVDRDGWLDLFVGNESGTRWGGVYAGSPSDAGTAHPSRLYRNDGDGTFTPVAEGSGLVVDAFVKGADWGDVDGDGRPDLYVSVLGEENRLFLNRTEGREIRFEEGARRAGVSEPRFSFPTWFFDADDDGHEDLLVLPYDLRFFDDVPARTARDLLGKETEVDRPRFYRNRGDGTFEDATRAAGWDRVLFAMGSNHGDLDNDGFEDVYVGTGAPDLRSIVPNRMFRGTGRRFEEITYAGGFGHLQKGHAVAFADFDRDGDQDVYAVIGGAVEGDVFRNALFENPSPRPGNAWVNLELRGRRANRDAIGARIRVVVEGPDGTERTLWRTVSTGGSFGSQSLLVELGLGAARRIVEVEVRWPHVEVSPEIFRDIPVRAHVLLEEGRGAARVLDRPAVAFRRGGPAVHEH